MNGNEINLQEAVEIFGDFRHKFVIATDEEEVVQGMTVELVNRNCEFEFDNVAGAFEMDLLYYFVVDLKLLNVDYSNYEVDKSNNGGKYAFAECEVLKVYEKSY